jgi:Pyridoxamine 5'-phosphate oxidase
MSVTLQTIEDFVRRDHGLAIASVVRPDGTPVGSLVNAGVLKHPKTGQACVGFVVQESAHKVRHLRSAPFVSLTWRDGWQWVGVGGAVELIGPNDIPDGMDRDEVRLLLRNVFTAAGGTHEDWDTYDSVMVSENRIAVLVEPTRLTGITSA